MASLLPTPLFCLEGDRKAPGNNAFISGWNLSDHCEIWLEALTRTGQELRLNVLPSPPVVLAPELFAQKMVPGDHRKAHCRAEKQLAQWRNVVASLEVITL